MQRLRLDWTLNTSEERLNFLKDYLNSPKFQLSPLTPEESEMCSNYVLWGKKEDGRSVVQDKKIQIKTKAGIWDETEPESLDALTESPTFNEATLSSLNKPQTIVHRTVFSREDARHEAPSYLLPIFEDLWRRIDEIDLIINFYDLAHEKRKNPPRESLLNRFSSEEIEEARESASHLNQFKYLKMRHELVELRNLQYTYRDSYAATIQRHTPPTVDPFSETFSIGVEIPVRPLGLFQPEDYLSRLLFRQEFCPQDYTQKDLQLISDFLWEDAPGRLFLDFRNEDHVYNLLDTFFDLEDSGAAQNIEGTTKFLLETLKFYIDKADLSEAQKEILDLKMKRWKNQQIAGTVNQKYSKTYSANYISTIFRQKIIKQICAAAMFHLEEVQNLFFPENWKKCTSCGSVKLTNEHNFVRKARSKDGFSNRCKCCDRLERQKKKEK